MGTKKLAWTREGSHGVLLLEEQSQNQIRPGLSTHWICVRLRRVLSPDCWGPDLLGLQEMAGSEPGVSSGPPTPAPQLGHH